MDSYYPSAELINPNIQFDTVIENFDGLYDYMLSGAAFLDDRVFDSGIGVTVDTGSAFDGHDLACGLVAADNEQNSGEANSFAGTTTTTAKPKRDRSKTLVSERKRRGRMKDRLYELRSMVPNITKMDKASIIADAIVYVQSLKSQAKKLVEEISLLESSFKEDQAFQGLLRNTKLAQVDTQGSSQCGAKVAEVVVLEIVEGTFYVKVECDKGQGVVSSLYRAMESLEHLHVESSNLSFTSDKFALATTLKVRRFGEPMGASSMKLFVMGALLKEGFKFDMSMMM